jgi:hypothetical protein
MRSKPVPHACQVRFRSSARTPPFQHLLDVELPVEANRDSRDGQCFSTITEVRRVAGTV